MKRLIIYIIFILVCFNIFCGGPNLKDYCNDFLINVINGNYNEVENYLKNGTDPNTKDSMFNNTAIIHAVAGNHEKIAILLYKYGADVNVKNNKGETLLMLSCQYHFKDFISLMINKISDINQKTNEGVTILEYLIFTDPMSWVEVSNDYEKIIIDILKILHKNGLNLDLKGSNNKKIIDVLAENFSYSDNGYPPSNIQKYFLDNGAVIDNIKTSIILNSKKDFDRLLNNENDIHKLTDLLIFIFNNYYDSYFSKKIIKKGFNINYKNNQGYNLLHLAAAGTTDVTVYEELLNKGININSKTNDGFTPLMICLKFYIPNENHPAIYFIKKGADVNILNNNDDSALLLTASFNNYFIFKYLIIANADLNQINKNGKNVLMILTENRIGSDKNADLLREAGFKAANIHEAVIIGDIKVIKKYADRKKELNKKLNNYNNSTPTHLAVKFNRIDILQYLLKNNVDINIKDKKGNTPLLLACIGLYGDNENIKKRTKIIKILLNSNPKIDQKNNIGNSALYYAIISKNLEIVKLLVESGADVNSINKNGQSLLIIENQYFDYDIAEYLIKNGINVNHQYIKDNSETALSNAVMYNNYKFINLLLKSGADPDALYYMKLHGPAITMLMLTTDEKIFNLLLKYGADINIKSSSNHEYFSYIYMMQEKYKYEWLKKRGYYLTTNVKTLNVRKKPDISSDIVDKIHYNEKLEYVKYTWGNEIDGIIANWIKIITPSGKSGWCFGGYLIITK